MLYGTTYYGGSSTGRTGTGCGTVCRLKPGKTGSTESIVYAFQGGLNGERPTGAVLASGAKLFGLTCAGGGSNCFEDRGACRTLYSVHP